MNAELKRCREAFEKWAIIEYGYDPSFHFRHSDKDDNKYYRQAVQGDWQIWQASWNTRPEPTGEKPENSDVLAMCEKMKLAIRHIDRFAGYPQSYDNEEMALEISQQTYELKKMLYEIRSRVKGGEL